MDLSKVGVVRLHHISTKNTEQVAWYADIGAAHADTGKSAGATESLRIPILRRLGS